ncbi:TetR/AcrR family transcriptional regulator [Prescottella equi]|uniref:TetR/AcrR family transcriptional regulator n=1 Tax=Rhodococcus hoagii TaxID=43767 RepID=UPI00301E6121
MTEQPGRRRRSTSEVRALITDAAYEEFTRSGFAHTSIKSVARRAGVSESMVFRHFSSKSELFQATAAGPLLRFLNEFATTISAHPEDDTETVTFKFVSGLYDLCTTNRRTLTSLLGSTEDGENRIHDEVTFESCLDALVEGIQQYVTKRTSRSTTDTRSAVRMVLTLVLGATLAGRDLYPTSWTETDIKHMLTQFVLSGTKAPLTIHP